MSGHTRINIFGQPHELVRCRTVSSQGHLHLVEVRAGDEDTVSRCVDVWVPRSLTEGGPTALAPGGPVAEDGARNPLDPTP